MKRKLCSIGCLLILLFQLVVPVGYAQTEEEGNSRVPQILQALGVITETGKIDKTITRGEFALLLCNMMGGGTGALDGAVAFEDVTPGDEISAAVAFVASMGYMSGYGNGSFGPMDPITAGDAGKVLVNVLGYRSYIEAKGGRAEDYRSMATGCGLYAGVAAGQKDPLTKEDAYQMIFNALTVEIAAFEIKNGQPSYTQTKGETILKKYLKAEKISGVITDNGVTALTGPTAAAQGDVVLRDTAYECADTKTLGYLGYNVEAYVTCRADGAQETLLIAFPDKNRVETILENNIDDATLTRVRYYPEGKDSAKELKLAKTVDFIYNNQSAPLRSTADLMPETGYVTAIDNNNDGVYEVYMVMEYTALVVNAVSADTEKIYAKYTGAVIDLEQKDYIIYRGLEEIELKDLAQWDVLSLYKSKDGKRIRMDVTTETMEGTVTSVKEDKAVINGTEYFVLPNVNKPLFSGLKGEFYLDIANRIVAVEDLFGEEDQFGYVVGASMADEEILYVRMFTTNGFWETLECAPKVKVDGTYTTNHQEIREVLQKNPTGSGTAQEDGVVPQAVKFKVNQNGALNMLDTLDAKEGEGQDSLKLSVPKASLRFKADGIFGGQMAATSDTFILKVSENVGQKDDFSICRISDFQVDTNYMVEAYNSSETLVPELIVYYGSADAGYEIRGHVYVVKEVFETLNEEEGETMTALQAYYNGQEVQKYAADSGVLSDVSQGDVLRCRMNSKGYISAVEKTYDVKTGTVTSPAASSATYFTSFYPVAGEVLVVENGLAILDVNGVQYVFNISNKNTYVCEENRGSKEVRVGSYQEISKGSHIFMHCSYGDVRTIVLYE